MRVAVEVAKATRLAITKTAEGSRSPAQGAGNDTVAEVHRIKAEGSCVKQQLFIWAAKDKYKELIQFKLEVTDTFLIRNHDIIKGASNK